MKKLKLLFLASFSFVFMKGQEEVPSLVKKRGEYTDLLVFRISRADRFDPKINNIFAWLMRESVYFWAECRSGLDPITRKMTVTVAGGKTFNFGKKTLFESRFHVTPKVGFVLGEDDNPITLECNVGGKLDKFTYFNLLQVVPGNGNRIRDIYFGFDYLTCGYRLKKWLQINFVAQIYFYNNHDYVLDQGGRIDFLKENFSFNAGYIFDIKNCIPKITAGVGYKF